MSAPAPSIELDCVNDILVDLGRIPLPQLSVTNISPDEAIARFQLRKNLRDLLTKKCWKFNYAQDVTYTADSGGRIELGDASTSRVLGVILNWRNPPIPFGANDVIERKDEAPGDAGGLGDGKWRLYDIIARKFDAFGAGGTVSLDIKYSRSLEEIPEEARKWVAAKAKIDTFPGRNVSGEKVSKAKSDRDEAWNDLLANHVAKGGLRAFDTQGHSRATIADNWDAGRLLVHQSYDLLRGGN